MKNYCINLSNIFSKSTKPQLPFDSKTIDAPAVRRDLDADVWSVILLKVDPHCIFKCILVCKEWLEVITSSFFRVKYLNKWKHSFPVIGFMRQFREMKLLGRNKLGSLMNKTKLMPISKFEFISKSSSGDGLVLCLDPEADMYYVFNLAARGGAIVTPLPPPPPFYYVPLMEIISEDASFKVIMLDGVFFGEVTSVSIQTFRSSTSIWEKSDLFCPERIRFTGMPGTASSRGVVYWQTDSYRLVAYDTNNSNQRECIRLIPTPVRRSNYEDTRSKYYEVSSEGNLRCATTHLKVIKIWGLNEDEKDCEWKLLYMVDLMDLGVMSKFKRASNYDSESFKFASFVPGRSDSIFVVWKSYIFIYNGDTQVLERFEGAASYWLYENRSQKFSLTTTDFGVWPSSPFSNHPTPNKPHRFKLLACV